MGKRKKGSALQNDFEGELDQDLSLRVALALTTARRPKVAKKGKPTAAGIVRQHQERIMRMRNEEGWQWREISDLLSAELGETFTSDALSKAASRARVPGPASPVTLRRTEPAATIVAIVNTTQPVTAVQSLQPANIAKDADSNPWRCFDD